MGCGRIGFLCDRLYHFSCGSNLIINTLLATVVAGCASASAADYKVDRTGVNGEFTTIQAALNAVSGQTSSNRANILIAPGTYNEELEINKPYVSFVGLGDGPEDVAIVSGGQGLGEPGVYVRGQATAFMAANLTFENPLPDNVSQGLALRSSADKSAFLDVRFLGYQDTLLVDNNSRQYFKDVFITGDTDFIFGNATAVFDHATIQSTDCCYVTAASTEQTTANGLVFLDSTLLKGTARSGSPPASAATNEVLLGRPWQWNRGKVPSTIFIRTKMDDHIQATGWNDWGSPSPDEDSRYSEFGSLDLQGNPLPLDNGRLPKPLGRVSWADGMNQEQADAYTLENIFGPVTFWNDNSNLQPEGTGVVYLPQGDGQAWDPIAQLALLPKQLLDCDYNRDGAVNGRDFLDWQLSNGSASFLAQWQSHYGWSSEAWIARAIPEPPSVVPLACFLVSTGGYVRSRALKRTGETIDFTDAASH